MSLFGANEAVQRCWLRRKEEKKKRRKEEGCSFAQRMVKAIDDKRRRRRRARICVKRIEKKRESPRFLCPFCLFHSIRWRWRWRWCLGVSRLARCFVHCLSPTLPSLRHKCGLEGHAGQGWMCGGWRLPLPLPPCVSRGKKHKTGGEPKRDGSLAVGWLDGSNGGMLKRPCNVVVVVVVSSTRFRVCVWVWVCLDKTVYPRTQPSTLLDHNPLPF